MAPPKRDLARWTDERTLRIVAGSILFTFATTHFFNAGMGLFGVEAADATRKVIGEFWEWRPVGVVLYSAFALHVFFALRRLARRRSWRMPWIEAVQTAFGLLIPLLLIPHVTATRGMELAVGLGANYRNTFLALWPDRAVLQATLLLLVWVHGCIGLGMALRSQGWFQRWKLLLLGFAIALPLFALSGFIAGAREAERRFPEGMLPRPDVVAAFNAILDVAFPVFYGILALVAALILFRWARSISAERLTVRYADGPMVRARKGATLLEVSRLNGIGHASVCGGKARCSTCRVRVIDGCERQPAPDQNERRLLARIGAPETVRLACQLRPTTDITVQRLVDPGSAGDRGEVERDPFHWGVERRITVMFADIRGFTTISERNFAFDIVFVLNRFQADMSRAIESHGGRIDKYLGDGLMAIFGAEGRDDGGARGALDAARAMQQAVVGLNAEFAPLIGAPLRIGIGLNTGPAILGRIGGSPRSAALTALGDTVNSAARLEELTKTYGTTCVASDATVTAAGFDTSGAVAHEVAVRGREATMRVWALDITASVTS